MFSDCGASNATLSSHILTTWPSIVDAEIGRRVSKKRPFDHATASDLHSQSLPIGTDSQLSQDHQDAHSSQSLLGGPGSMQGSSSSAMSTTPTPSITDSHDTQLVLAERPRSNLSANLVWGDSAAGRGHGTHYADTRALVLHQDATISGPNDAEQRRLLEAMPHSDLVSYSMRQAMTISQQANQLEQLKHERRMDRQRIRRLTQRVDVIKEKLEDAKNPDVDDLAVHRGSGSKITWRGQISLGLRKAISITSASSFPQASLVSVSKQTVLRSEVLTASYLITRARFFHKVVYLLLKQLATTQHQQQQQQQEQSLQAPPSAEPDSNSIICLADAAGNQPGRCLTHDDSICKDLGLPLLGSHFASRSPMTSTGGRELGNPFSIGCTFWSGDATNSSIWKRQKLQGLLASSHVMTDWNALQKEDYTAAFADFKAMCCGQFQKHCDMKMQC